MHFWLLGGSSSLAVTVCCPLNMKVLIFSALCLLLSFSAAKPGKPRLVCTELAARLNYNSVLAVLTIYGCSYTLTVF